MNKTHVTTISYTDQQNNEVQRYVLNLIGGILNKLANALLRHRFITLYLTASHGTSRAYFIQLSSTSHCIIPSTISPCRQMVFGNREVKKRARHAAKPLATWSKRTSTVFVVPIHYSVEIPESSLFFKNRIQFTNTVSIDQVILKV